MAIDFTRVMKYADHGFIKPREPNEIQRISDEVCKEHGETDLAAAFDAGKIDDVVMFDCFFTRTIDIPMMERELEVEDQFAAISYMLKKRFG